MTVGRQARSGGGGVEEVWGEIDGQESGERVFWDWMDKEKDEEEQQ